MFFFKKLEKVINTAPINNQSTIQNVPYIFDTETLSIIDKLLIKKQIAVEVINDIVDDNSRPIIPLVTLTGGENFNWLYDTGAQATC